MTPGDSTEPMTSTGSAGSSLPKFPTRPEDVQAHRAALDGERPDLRAFDGLETTTGHYFRGVE